MNCVDCRNLLTTAGVAELAANEPARAHLDGCVECAGMALEITVATRRLGDALNDLGPSYDPAAIAQTAYASGPRPRRRLRERLGRPLAFLVALAAAAFTVIVAMVMIVPSVRSVIIATRSFQVVTVPLKCLTSGQARELA